MTVEVALASMDIDMVACFFFPKALTSNLLFSYETHMIFILIHHFILVF